MNNGSIENTVLRSYIFKYHLDVQCNFDPSQMCDPRKDKWRKNGLNM